VRKLAIALLLLTTVAACGGGGGDSGKKGASTTTKSTAEKTLAPLTGRAVAADVAARPSLAVKVDNHPDARPQSGLEDADIVFEELTEGGITRFLAVFQSQLPPEVGPIRSVRAVDPALVTPLGGVFAYSGGTPPNVAAIRAAPVTTVDETAAGTAMHRSSQRRAPHNLYGAPEKLLALAGPHDAPPQPVFEYGRASAAANAHSCQRVSIKFSSGFVSIYDWVVGAGWRRSMPRGPFTVASGKQVTPTNLVVLWLKDQSREATVGSGDAMVFRDGTFARGSWQRRDEHDAFHLTGTSDAALTLAPGSTWVHLAVQGDTTVDTQECAPAT
jgi:DUF3048 family protein